MGKNSAIRRQAAPEDTGRDMEQDIVNPGPVTHWEKDLHDSHLQNRCVLIYKTRVAILALQDDRRWGVQLLETVKLIGSVGEVPSSSVSLWEREGSGFGA